MADPVYLSTFDTAPLEDLCAVVPRSRIMSAALRQILISHFSDEDRIEDPCLKGLIWTGLPNGSSAPESKIKIEMASTWLANSDGARPAILLKRNALRTVPFSINNELHGVVYDEYTRYEALKVGSHTIFCLGATDGQAEDLGTEVERTLLMFGPAIRAELNLIRFQSMGQEELHQLDEYKATFVVPVTVAYQFTDRWRLKRDAEPLEGIDACCSCDGCFEDEESSSSSSDD